MNETNNECNEWKQWSNQFTSQSIVSIDGSEMNCIAEWMEWIGLLISSQWVEWVIASAISSSTNQFNLFYYRAAFNSINSGSETKREELIENWAAFTSSKERKWNLLMTAASHSEWKELNKFIWDKRCGQRMNGKKVINGIQLNEVN